MAESSVQVKDHYICSVCLDLMTDPVTIPCGHSYCKSCIQDCWKKNPSPRAQCPQCRHEFTTTPALSKNIMLAEILEKLSIPKRLPTCPKHDQPLEAFCRTDDTCICLRCLIHDHKGHDTVSCAEQRQKKQVTLRENKLKFVEKRKEKQKDLDEAMKTSAANAQVIQQSVDATEQAFSSLISSLRKSCSELIGKFQHQEKIHKNRVEQLHEKLTLEICSLMEQEDVMDELLATGDDAYFLQNFASMPSFPAAETSASPTSQPLEYFSDMRDMISDIKVKLDVFQQELDKISAKHTPRIEIGDRVRVKSSVKTPKFNWGAVTYTSVGVVVSVSDETLIVNFQENKKWKGILSEMERVTDKPAQLQSTIKVGDRVRVKPSVIEPKLGWGSVAHGSVGVIKRIAGERINVDFPAHSNWNGIVSEMEIVS